MRALSIGPDHVVLAPTFLPANSNATISVPADTVVFVSRNRPNRDLADALRERGIAVSLVGDANAPRLLLAAIREGNQAGTAA